MSSAVKERILQELDGLSDEELDQVLARVIGGPHERPATVADLVAEFGGAIPEDELDRMERAIEEDCERIEPA